MKKIKVCFMFGAGAEGNGQYGLPSGAVFNKDVILNEKGKTLLLNFNKGNKLNDYIKTSNSKNILYNSYLSLYNLLKTNEEFRNKFLDNDVKKTIYHNYDNMKSNDTTPKKNEAEAHRKNFLDLYNDNIYAPLTKKEIIKEYNEDLLNEFLENCLLIDELDKKFSSLADPMNNKCDAGRVLNTYFAAMNSVVSRMIESNKNCVIDRSNYIEQLEASYDKFVNNNKSTYYTQIKDLIKEYQNKVDFKFVTSNYTKIAEKVIELNKDDISYFHGNLEYFENLITKEIKHFKEFDDSDIIFPYLVIRSGIKPVINPYQIVTWNKTLESINDSILIIIGLGLNKDDEHIINIIRYYLNKNLTMYYLDYNGGYDKALNVIKPSANTNNFKRLSFDKNDKNKINFDEVFNEICKL